MRGHGNGARTRHSSNQSNAGHAQATWQARAGAAPTRAAKHARSGHLAAGSSSGRSVRRAATSRAGTRAAATEAAAQPSSKQPPAGPARHRRQGRQVRALQMVGPVTTGRHNGWHRQLATGSHAVGQASMRTARDPRRADARRPQAGHSGTAGQARPGSLPGAATPHTARHRAARACGRTLGGSQKSMRPVLRACAPAKGRAHETAGGQAPEIGRGEHHTGTQGHARRAVAPRMPGRGGGQTRARAHTRGHGGSQAAGRPGQGGLARQEASKTHALGGHTGRNGQLPKKTIPRAAPAAAESTQGHTRRRRSERRQLRTGDARLWAIAVRSSSPQQQRNQAGTHAHQGAQPAQPNGADTRADTCSTKKQRRRLGTHARRARRARDQQPADWQRSGRQAAHTGRHGSGSDTSKACTQRRRSKQSTRACATRQPVASACFRAQQHRPSGPRGR